jgi:succinate dehydrogenase flavin-adding protein (antitoxin of CptAB toxin-antitoxin module)
VAGAFQRRGLRKAAEALGGEVQLRRFLEVSSTDLFRWLRGQAPIPDDVFRKVVNLLADVEAGILPPAEGPTPPPDHPTPSR